MLNEHDMEWLIATLAATAEVLGQQLTPGAALLMAEDLAIFDREVLAQALVRVRSEHAGKLTLKVVLDRVDELSGRLAPNEAWALALRALDERETVVWTDEVAAAWGQARPVAEAGDKVGARMAFLSAYERIVREGREMRRQPVVLVSEGWDAAGRNAALDQAVSAGLLTDAQAQRHRPQLQAPAFNPMALLTTDLTQPVDAPSDIKERLAALRAEIRQRAMEAERFRVAQAAAQQAQWDERKRRAAELARAALKAAPPPIHATRKEAA
ncbi:hypothetical protein EII18_02990 [Comamonadaceae bacterium OH3737_COT-264]|nr:hypothetical protein EII18_02990 [Comamonadaceae bacterium OH3737_COT-264]